MSSPSRGPAAPALPAWKQAILERKRAKLAAGVEPAAAGPLRLPPLPAAQAEEKPAKEPQAAGAGAAADEEPRVVAESLGPLRENPFMRLESERRRRRRRRVLLPSSPPPPPPPPLPSRAPPESPAPPPPPAAPASPEPPALSQLLELYSSMPGIRTIRADNILIIESRGEGEPGAAAAARKSPPPRVGGLPVPPGQHQPQPRPSPGSPRGGGARDPWRALVARAGSPVTEIRAAEVVLYEPRPASPAAAAPESEPGRVSRLLQKFDRRPRGGGVARGRWRTGDHPLPPARPEAAPVPNACPEDGPASPVAAATAAAPAQPESPGHRLLPVSPVASTFVQKIGANSFTVNPRGHRPSPAPSEQRAGPAPGLSNGPLEPEEGPLPLQAVAPAAAAPKPVPSAASPARANAWKPKREGPVAEGPSLLPSCATPVSSASTPRAQPPPGAGSGAFEIRPADKPDLAAIPAHDLQAQALASLWLNSRNSFLLVPRRAEEAPGLPEPSETFPGGLPEEARPAAPQAPVETLVPVTYIDDDVVAVEPDAGRLPPLRALSPRLEGFVPQEGSLALEVDDSALPPAAYKPHPAGSAALSQRGSNTFTVVPKRKPPAAGLEVFNRAWVAEEEEAAEEEESRARGRTGAPHQELGQLLKKRYPTVNEIEVIGGYLSLDKSCMSKAGSRRKKMKISFNESRLQTMFEYPSESSLVEEEDEDEDEEEDEEYATEVDEPPALLLIPRPNSSTLSSITNSGLSSYTPKHSLEFSKWQDQQGEPPPRPGAFLRDADPRGNSVMLTPADQSSLSDFSSEPALYF